MTEDEGKKGTEKQEVKADEQKPAGAGSKTPENGQQAAAPGARPPTGRGPRPAGPDRGGRPDQQGRPQWRGPNDRRPPYGQQSRPQERTSTQANGSSSAPTDPPTPSRPPQQEGGPSQQRPSQQTGKSHMEWLRSKPVSSARGGQPSQPQRGLDLGRHDAWSGRQKPTSTTPRPPQSEQRPSAPSTTTGGQERPRPSGGSEGYRGQRPYSPGQPGTGRPSTGYPSGPRPGGYGTGTGRAPYGPRPGGGRPFPGGATPDWAKTATSRRARSARKGGKEKDKDKLAVEEEVGANGVRRGEGKPGVAARAGGLRPAANLKAKLEAAPDTSKGIVVPRSVTVKDLAEILGISSVDIIKELMKNGIMAPINQVIDFETAAIVASDLGFDIRPEDGEAEAEPAAVAEAPATPSKRVVIEDDPASLVPRPPVVTIMGHVDHGKTSLLDAIRRTNVAAGEFGGITQHIAAYQVEERGKKITFLDTPGHEAFTAMRARGAQVTDVAVVVVAADDGVQPQTLEAINHARAASVPIVVALNKIDKETANVDRVKQQLADAGLVPEDWGGNTVVVPVSAKTGSGVNDLLDMILLVADMADLKANPSRPAVGTVVEAKMDKTKGPFATVLVQHGTLQVGDHVVVGSIYGKIRAMTNDKGKAIRKATPATPVGILGLSDVPQAGDVLEVIPGEHEARDLAAERLDQAQREAAITVAPAVDLEGLFKQIQAGTVKELNIVLKADVQGSLEPIVNSLKKLGDEKVKVHLLHAAPGLITESDVTLAAASKPAIVIGFNVEPDAAARRTAELMGVEVRTFKIIYELTDAIEKALKGLYEPKYEDAVDGHAEVRQVFKLSKGVTIAGVQVTDGQISRNSTVRVRRNDTVVFEGKVSSLRRFKDDVREVTAGLECGISLEGFNDFMERDILEAYHKERVN